MLGCMLGRMGRKAAGVVLFTQRPIHRYTFPPRVEKRPDVRSITPITAAGQGKCWPAAARPWLTFHRAICAAKSL
jgi:hypothetical protein